MIERGSDRSRLLAVLAVLGTPFGAQAQAVLDYSAASSAILTLSGAEISDWTLQKRGRTVDIVLPGLPGLDTTAVDSLPTGRVVSATATSTAAGTTLSLETGCACAISLVPGPDGVAEIHLFDTRQTDIAATGGTDRASAWSPLPVARASATPVATDATGLPAPAEGDVDERVREAHAWLLENLQIAAANDLIDVAPGGPLEPSGQETASDEAPAPMADAEVALPSVAEPAAAAADRPSAEAAGPSPAPSPTPTPTARRTAEDTPTADPTTDPAPVAPAAVSAAADPPSTDMPASAHPLCLLPVPVGWSALSLSPGGFRTSLEKKSRLLGEFDRTDPLVVIDLARDYIEFGAYPEAKALLAEFAPDDPETPGLLSIAGMLDPDHPDPVRNERPDCAHGPTVWTALHDLLWGDPVAALAAVPGLAGQLKQLPPGLRAQLAGRFGLAALEHGREIQARNLEALAVRSATAAGPEQRAYADLLSAYMLERRGDRADAVRMLDTLRRGSGPAATEALMHLADLVIAGEVDTPDDGRALRLDLGTFASLNRGFPEAEEAILREARLLDAEQRRDQSLDVLDFGSEMDLVSQSAYIDGVARAGQTPALAGSNRPLALIYLEQQNDLEPAMEQTAFRKAVARSMMDIGVPGLAADVLRPEDYSDAALVTALADSMTRSGEPETALVLADRLPAGPVRERVKGEAHFALGAADTALPLLANGADRPKETRAHRIDAALQVGDWSTALTGLSEQLADEATTATATRLALVALQSGAETIPEDAATFLTQNDPDRLAGLEALYGPSVDVTTGPPSVPGVLDYVDQVSRELNAARELLDNG